MTRIDQLRNHAISHSLFRPTTLKAAVNRLGFVQADPIRSPARAQDLILRHRVNGYRAGDLDRRYPKLNVEEDVLYAYGYLPRNISILLHPRNIAKEMDHLQREVLKAVRKFGPTHPRELKAHFGDERVVNGWGGYSKATKRSLEGLHHRGLLRVAKRESGIRIYEASSLPKHSLSPEERFREILRVVANILAPVNEKFLLSIATYFRYLVPRIAERKSILRTMIQTGELEEQTIDGLIYVWPTAKNIHREAPRQVRFLAPFDPLVRDRDRFEHLWQWTYRFEAYTPIAKRLRGYYAMPLLWIDRVIGWANADVVEGKLRVEIGYVKQRPKGRDFRNEVEAEVTRLAEFLHLDDSSWELVI
jgi:uncharacterized protein YcaQ